MLVVERVDELLAALSGGGRHVVGVYDPYDRGPMKVLGFPLHVRPGFLFFMVLIVALYRDEFGVWLAGAIAVFTLLHELGHALAARRAGATAEISLDFLAGYASYTSEQPLSRGTEAGIALAGPVTHITAGLLVLLAMGVNPLVAIERGQTPASAAVWWAGVAIGAFNLIPVLPLDGGNVVTSALDHFAPGKARHWMTYASVVITVGAMIAFSLNTQLRGFVVFLGLLVLMQLQGIFEERDEHAVSIFDRAAAAIRAGDEAKAARAVSKGMRKPSEQPLVPQPLPAAELRRLLAVLPRPLPTGDPWNEYVLTTLLVHGGEHREAATYGAESYARTPQPLLAATIARAAGGLGDEATAIAWLRAAVHDGTSPQGIATVIDRAPELAHIRQLPDVVAMRRALQPTG
jgi:Zn-dependent protease